ncbi:permease [Planctomycetales bacterium]|nr:permease [Planctomycetales bacterium]GHT05499.1 permease [Planctomycetales bacterium]
MDTWFLPTLLSSVVLGFYILTGKPAMRGNAIAPAIFLSSLCGTLFYLAVGAARGAWRANFAIDAATWGLIFGKSAIVAASFYGVYYGLRELPLSLAAPLRAASPLLTFFAAVLLYGEIPTWGQAAAAAIMMGGYGWFSVIGEKEGISFAAHRGIRYLIFGTILGAAASLYDKYLFGVARVPFDLGQFWFMVNMTVILGAGWLVARVRRPQIWHWRWAIPLNGVLLVAADTIYFYALTLPETPISLVSVLRRSSVIVTFAVGAYFYRDRHLFVKSAALAVVLFGIALLAWCH